MATEKELGTVTKTTGVTTVGVGEEVRISPTLLGWLTEQPGVHVTGKPERRR